MKRLALVLLGLFVGCGGQRRELTVLAAASLRDVFEDVSRRFETRHGVAVVLVFAGSQELRAQLEHGARGDVFASAATKDMAALEAAGLAHRSRVFAGNDLVIVVPKGNPAGVSSLGDLDRARRLVLGAEEVPIGAYTQQVLDRAGSDVARRVLARVVSRELNVRQVLAKVKLGEADAGIVYRTDALAAGDRVEVIAIPAGLNVEAEYPVAVLKGARQPELGQAFIDDLLGEWGQERLRAAGFSR